MNESRPISASIALTSWRLTGRLGGDDLLVWRRGEGLSQTEAGRWLGWSQAMVSDIERGRGQPPVSLHERIMWGLWRYYGLVGEDWVPPKRLGKKKRRARVKRPDPFDKYEQLARESQLKTPFKR